MITIIAMTQEVFDKAVERAWPKRIEMFPKNVSQNAEQVIREEWKKELKPKADLRKVGEMFAESEILSLLEAANHIRGETVIHEAGHAAMDILLGKVPFIGIIGATRPEQEGFVCGNLDAMRDFMIVERALATTNFCILSRAEEVLKHSLLSAIAGIVSTFICRITPSASTWRNALYDSGIGTKYLEISKVIKDASVDFSLSGDASLAHRSALCLFEARRRNYIAIAKKIVQAEKNVDIEREIFFKTCEYFKVPLEKAHVYLSMFKEGLFSSTTSDHLSSEVHERAKHEIATYVVEPFYTQAIEMLRAPESLALLWEIVDSFLKKGILYHDDFKRIQNEIPYLVEKWSKREEIQKIKELILADWNILPLPEELKTYEEEKLERVNKLIEESLKKKFDEMKVSRHLFNSLIVNPVEVGRSQEEGDKINKEGKREEGRQDKQMDTTWEDAQQSQRKEEELEKQSKEYRLIANQHADEFVSVSLWHRYPRVFKFFKEFPRKAKEKFINFLKDVKKKYVRFRSKDIEKSLGLKKEVNEKKAILTHSAESQKEMNDVFHGEKGKIGNVHIAHRLLPSL